MGGKSIGLIAVVLVALFLLMSGCGTYNSLVKSEEDVKAAWAQVQNQYQRRADLVDNLVATVKGAATHEQETLTKVVEARAKASSITVSKDVLDDPEAMRKFEAAQGELSGALKSLIAVSEAYPDLKANQNFLVLQGQLEGMENRIAVERGKFNAVVQDYNTQVRRFPANIFAGIFGFRQRPTFEAQPGSEVAPKVDFSK
jgi:LemA protein